jgi:hypothetical protein
MPIALGTNDSALREQLAQLTKPADATELREQIQQMINLAVKPPHSVTLLAEEVAGTPPFNCYQYAFGIADVRLRDGILQIVPGRDFAQFLVDLRLTQIEPPSAENGDYALYSDSRIEHAGKVQSGMIESKWGTGHTWRHRVYEVPANYGDTVRFFRHISPEDILSAALDFHPNTRIEK